ncbi:NAD(P)/FAD-dependent oxidoreductase [Lichenifustis flavocetrariae]|uniref:NAD(P)/FAD-dependent oxidoreductase n=1 Tax=Lichenifustis flavocetrariae TaxID=2949735 RepID=A0AA41Z3L4_9HYPH|nr:NAD(P)/FAD-dependent oxidoreductase [Lichenifustis flavocetrariae]MCW6512165.1 NAD(P)/FAD-dependent oxidoreductase [Lichenifustis flavocetrariae]
MDFETIVQACQENIDGLTVRLRVPHRAARAGLLPPPAPEMRADAHARLVALTRRVHHDLEILIYPKDEWVVPRRHPEGRHVYDVVIVGAGQCGLAVAFGLLRERVGNILVLDRAPKGREGPWITYSRMWTLRSPKHVTGPDLGIPSLAPRSWFEAVFGEDGWEQLGKWPRQAWQAYLDWYRAALDLPVCNDVEVRGFEQDRDFVRVLTDGMTPVSARKVVLATGLEGVGGWHVPAMVRDKLPSTSWTLCTDDVDSLAWKGQRIAVLGAGATAWDRTADLLELGAAHVAMYMRRPQILTANPFRYLEKAGYLRHYASMDDADKWRWIQTIFAFGQPPTQDGVDRCAAFETFSLHPGAAWSDVEQTHDGIRVSASDGSTALYDHLFIGCGFSMDPRNRRELAALADNIATWTDVFTAPEEQPDPWLATYPYLNRDLSLVEKVPGRTPVLAHVHCFNYGATVTNAHSGASLSGLRYGIEPLIHGITHALWKADEPEHFARVSAWAVVDTDPSSLKRHRRPPNP